MALGVGDFERRATIVAEIELGKVAMQVSLAAMLIDADHAALEHGKDVLNRIGVDDFPAFVADIFLGRMLGRLV